MSQKPKSDIFQGAIFCTLSSSTNLVLKLIPIEAGKDLCPVFSVFSVRSFHAFLRKLKVKEKFLHNYGKNVCRILTCKHILRLPKEKGD